MDVTWGGESCDFSYILKSIGVDDVYFPAVVDDDVSQRIPDGHGLGHIAQSKAIGVEKNIVSNSISFHVVIRKGSISVHKIAFVANEKAFERMCFFFFLKGPELLVLHAG